MVIVLSENIFLFKRKLSKKLENIKNSTAQGGGIFLLCFPSFGYTHPHDTRSGIRHTRHGAQCLSHGGCRDREDLPD